MGVPIFGVINTGDVPKTNDPDPVSSVIALAKLALVGPPKNVAIPDARPEIPVLTGRPVALVNIAVDGVPMFGVIKTALVLNTKLPVPTSSEIVLASSDDEVDAKVLNLSVVFATLVIAPDEPLIDKTPALAMVGVAPSLPKPDNVIPVPATRLPTYAPVVSLPN